MTPRGPPTMRSTNSLGGDAGLLGLVLDLLAVLVGRGRNSTSQRVSRLYRAMASVATVQ